MPRCCLTTSDPGSWKAGVNDTADPEMVARMHGIRNKLSYQMPMWDLIVALKEAIQLDSRTKLGGDIQRCLLSNAAHRLEVLALLVNPTPWSRLPDRIKDAWAVIRGRAVCIYVEAPK